MTNCLNFRCLGKNLKGKREATRDERSVCQKVFKNLSKFIFQLLATFAKVKMRLIDFTFLCVCKFERACVCMRVRASESEVRVLEVALREKLFFIFLGVSTSLSLIWVVPRKRKFSFSLCPFSPFVNFFFLLLPFFFILSFHLSLLLSFVVFPIHDVHLCFLSLSVSLLTITLFLKLSSNFFGFFPLFSFYSN